VILFELNMVLACFRLYLSRSPSLDLPLSYSHSTTLSLVYPDIDSRPSRCPFTPVPISIRTRNLRHPNPPPHCHNAPHRVCYEFTQLSHPLRQTGTRPPIPSINHSSLYNQPPIGRSSPPSKGIGRIRSR
jgi:hypothetical protein